MRRLALLLLCLAPLTRAEEADDVDFTLALARGLPSWRIERLVAPRGDGWRIGRRDPFLAGYHDPDPLDPRYDRRLYGVDVGAYLRYDREASVYVGVGAFLATDLSRLKSAADGVLAPDRFDRILGLYPEVGLQLGPTPRWELRLAARYYARDLVNQVGGDHLLVGVSCELSF